MYCHYHRIALTTDKTEIIARPLLTPVIWLPQETDYVQLTTLWWWLKYDSFEHQREKVSPRWDESSQRLHRQYRHRNKRITALCSEGSHFTKLIHLSLWHTLPKTHTSCVKALSVLLKCQMASGFIRITAKRVCSKRKWRKCQRCFLKRHLYYFFCITHLKRSLFRRLLWRHFMNPPWGCTS